jgi:hypothetical protein
MCSVLMPFNDGHNRAKDRPVQFKDSGRKVSCLIPSPFKAYGNNTLSRQVHVMTLKKLI